MTPIRFADTGNTFGTPNWYARENVDGQLVAQCSRCSVKVIVAETAPEGYRARRELVEAWWESHALGKPAA